MENYLHIAKSQNQLKRARIARRCREVSWDVRSGGWSLDESVSNGSGNKSQVTGRDCVIHVAKVVIDLMSSGMEADCIQL